MKLNPIKKIAGWMLALAVLLPHAGAAQNLESQFTSHVYNGADDTELQYRLHVPPAAADTSALPLLVYLHGSGGWGSDNVAQISGGNMHGAGLGLREEVAAAHPAFILAPQLPAQEPWANPGSAELSVHGNALLELIDELEQKFAIDSRRIYLLGQSLGGAGVWDIVSKRPEHFAAAIPVCGFGNSEWVVNARNVPIWAFHGVLDGAVAVERSRELVAALRTVDGDVRYTEYPDVTHNSWVNAFSEPALVDWLFSKSLE